MLRPRNAYQDPELVRLIEEEDGDGIGAIVGWGAALAGAMFSALSGSDVPKAA